MKRFMLWIALGAVGWCQPGGAVDWARSRVGPLFELYQQLHQSPELSFRETRTAARITAELQKLGVEVSPIGGTGLVGVLRNGPGPTVMLRTDLDALPLSERTGLPYASLSDGVMHACGHDMHMTTFVGVAGYLAEARKRWSGTLLLVGEPAEELGEGAQKLLTDGLFQRFPRPDYALAVHVEPNLAAGSVGYRAGYLMACADRVKVSMQGRGGHGATPHLTVDPVAQAARLVVDLPSIPSREVSALEPVVITVGMIQGGTKSSIVPDQCELQMTVRTFAPEVRQRVLQAIERKARAIASAVGAPEPVVEVDPQPTPALRNDPQLVKRLLPTLRNTLGEAQVVEVEPAMIAEDFSRYGLAGVPSAMFLLGATEPGRLRTLQQAGTRPSLHSSSFYPDFEPTLVTGVVAMSESLIALFADPR